MTEKIDELLYETLVKLKASLSKMGEGLQVESNNDQNGALKVEEFKKLAEAVIAIVEEDLSTFNQENHENKKTKPLAPLYKQALLNHYLNVIIVLITVLDEPDPTKMAVHEKTIKDLGDASQPKLKALLYGLASLCSWLSIVLSGKVLALAAGAAGPAGGMAIGVPTLILADKIKVQANRLSDQSYAHYYHAQAIQSMEEKKIKKLSEKNKDTSQDSKNSSVNSSTKNAKEKVSSEKGIELVGPPKTDSKKG